MDYNQHPRGEKIYVNILKYPENEISRNLPTHFICEFYLDMKNSLKEKCLND